MCQSAKSSEGLNVRLLPLSMACLEHRFNVSPAAAAFKLAELKCTVRERRIITVSIWILKTFGANPDCRPAAPEVDLIAPFLVSSSTVEFAQSL
jgi:hypothetical protein